ncbi:MAG: chemotaxis protein CheC [Gammaproteobacteria bacterium]
MVALTDMERDAFSEVLNIGVGHASSSLSQMVNQEIKLSIPHVEVLERQEAIRILAGEEENSVTGVREKFAGAFEGEAFIFFPEESSLELVRLLMGDELPLDVLTEMEQEALTEVGNIILTGCLCSIADLLGEEISNELPEFAHGEAKKLLLSDDEVEDQSNQILLLKTKIMFNIKDKDIQGHITFLMDMINLDQFRGKVIEVFGLEAEG